MFPTSSSPAVDNLAASNDTFAALIALQERVLQIMSDDLSIQPAENHVSPLSLSGQDNASGGIPGVGALLFAWTGPRGAPRDANSKVRWVSASSVANTAMSFGTTRLMGWVSNQLGCPHYVLELGLMGPETVQCTLSLAQRCDIVLDLEYLETFYNTPVPGLVSSYNEVYNRCMKRQLPSSGGWMHYQVPQCDMKPVLANSISYTMAAQADNVEDFAACAEDVARLWTHMVNKSSCGGPESSTNYNLDQVNAYDARLVDVVLNDPGNAIAVKLFGEDNTKKLLHATIGRL